MARMTARQLRRFNGLIAQVAAAESRPGDPGPRWGNRILREIEAPDLGPAIAQLEKRLTGTLRGELRGAA